MDNQLVSEIKRGLCVLVGLSQQDTIEDVDYLVKKILNLRFFENEQGKAWSKSVKDLGLEVLSGTPSLSKRFRG